MTAGRHTGAPITNHAHTCGETEGLLTWKTSRFCLRSGSGNSILRSNRPGLSSAGSRVSARLVAMMTFTFTVWSNPSICSHGRLHSPSKMCPSSHLISSPFGYSDRVPLLDGVESASVGLCEGRVGSTAHRSFYNCLWEHETRNT